MLGTSGKFNENTIVDRAVTGARELSLRVQRFGATDLQVSPFGLGCARIGGIFKSNPADFVTLLSTAYDRGINFFDTADIYSQGESERLIGRAFRGRRDRIIIASKAGYVLPSQRRLAARLKPLLRPVIRLVRLARSRVPAAVRGSLQQDFSAPYVTRSIEGSLHRLGTDYLDLFQLHSPPLDVVESGEVFAELERLKQHGKIRYYGVSCDSVDVALAALRHPGVSSLQVVINMLERAALAALPGARERGVGVIARECLANGLLVKPLDEIDVRAYSQSDEEAARKRQQLEEYHRLSSESGRPIARLALDYVSGLDGVAVSLIGVSRLEQLQELMATALPQAG